MLKGKIYKEANAIAGFGGKFAFATSLGRDTAVMLHVMSRLLHLPDHRFFTWTRYPCMLPYQQRYLEQIEGLYGISVEVSLFPEDMGMKRKVWWEDYMDRNGCSLVLFGERKDESLQRRGMLNPLKDGIDYRFRKAFPLRSFTARNIRGYVNAHRLPLSVEYKIGIKGNLDEFRGPRAYALRHYISELDYRCAVAQDPNVEIDYVRFVNDPEFRAECEKSEGWFNKGAT